MADHTQPESLHPDLRPALCHAINQLMSAAPDLPPEYRLTTTVRPEHVTIRCQRTWLDISTINQHLNGGGLSACVAMIQSGDELFSCFVEAVRLPETSEWGCASMVGPKRASGPRDKVAGFKLANGSHVCVGGQGSVPEGGTLRVDMADGTSFEDTSVDGCCIVFAPLTTSLPPEDDFVTVRVFDAVGTELSADRAWFGGGDRPRQTP